MERRIFPRAERLKKSAAITAVFRSGTSVSRTGAKLFLKRNGLSHNRIAFVFSRKFGNAVKRNRARRLGREAWRFLRGTLKTGYDMALLVYPDENAVFATRYAQLAALFDKAMVTKDGGI